MNEDVELYIDDCKDRMNKAVQHFEKELITIRAGKANPHVLDAVTVDYYGTPTILSRISNVGVSDARTIVIQPWEKKMIEPIEKAILKANLGFNPMNNGEVIRIMVPVLTEERRKQLVKQVKGESENTKVAIRNVRRETLEELKVLKKNGLEEDQEKEAEELVQKLTNDFIKKTDELVEIKEKEIMTV